MAQRKAKCRAVELHLLALEYPNATDCARRVGWWPAVLTSGRPLRELEIAVLIETLHAPPLDAVARVLPRARKVCLYGDILRAYERNRLRDRLSAAGLFPESPLEGEERR